MINPDIISRRFSRYPIHKRELVAGLKQLFVLLRAGSRLWLLRHAKVLDAFSSASQLFTVSVKESTFSMLSS